jgi:hypothetical protein
MSKVKLKSIKEILEMYPEAWFDSNSLVVTDSETYDGFSIRVSDFNKFGCVIDYDDLITMDNQSLRAVTNIYEVIEEKPVKLFAYATDISGNSGQAVKFDTYDGYSGVNGEHGKAYFRAPDYDITY